MSGIDISLLGHWGVLGELVGSIKLKWTNLLGHVSDIVDPEYMKIRKLSEELLLFGWYTLLGRRRAGWVDNVRDDTSGFWAPAPTYA